MGVYKTIKCVCDRCGFEVETETNSKLPTPDLPEKWGNIKTPSAKYVLCGNCIDKLIDAVDEFVKEG